MSENTQLPVLFSHLCAFCVFFHQRFICSVCVNDDEELAELQFALVALNVKSQ